MRQSIGSKEGSVLLATAGITLVAAAVVGGYLKMTLMELKLSQKTFLMQRAMNLAEAGLEEGMDAINTDDWTGWTSVGYFRDITNISFSDTREAQIRVYIEDYDTELILASEGRS